MKHGIGPLLGLSLSLWVDPLAAQPQTAPPFQWNASLSLGAASYGDQGDLWRATRFSASVRTDVFFGRTSNQSFGLGPTLFAGVTTYSEANLGVGAQLLLPVHELAPIVLGAGVYGANRENQQARTGGFASVGWGLRSFNYHSSYALAGGLLLEARHDFSELPVTTWVANAQLDAALVALPFVWLVNAFR